MRSALRAAAPWLLAASTAATACGGHPGWTGATPESWLRLRAELDSRRAALAAHAPWSARVSVTMREPRSGRTIDARGAVAVAPGRAVRMILVGGAGSTVLDAWVTPERWRVEVPPVALLRRGGADAPADLPVAFLRWWFFRPLEGALVAASDGGGGASWVLRDGDAALEVHASPCERGTRTTAARRVAGRTERIDACGASAPPAGGDHVRYEDDASGLLVELSVEALSPGPPSAEAFGDPDAP